MPLGVALHLPASTALAWDSQSSDGVGPSGDPIHFIKAAAARGWVTIELPVLPLLSWRLRHTSPFTTQAYLSYKQDEIDRAILRA